MSKIRYQNEKVKRKFLDFCRESKGFSEKTIKVKERALWKYDEFTKNQDYKKFNSETAKGFKKWLATSNKHNSNAPLDITTQFHILRNLKEFFMWLSQQSGYKSRIKIDDVSYLRLSREDTRKATTSKQPDYPSLDYVVELCSFEVRNEIDMRDRALIAFTAISAMRDLAIVSLPMECFNPRDLLVTQDPNFGVRTKYSKLIYTTLFKFNGKLIDYVTEWYSYLKKELLFDNKNPLFPATKIELASETQHAFVSNGVSKEFWSDAGPMRKIFRTRAKQMGVKYYQPHKFRHFAIREASNRASTPEQLKAISQNVGHERLSTTFFSYGAIDTFRLAKVIADIDFTKNENN